MSDQPPAPGAAPSGRPWVSITFPAITLPAITVPRMQFRDAVVTAIIAAFIVAYFREATPDQMMKGALLTAFAAAWGFHLGSSKGAAENRDALNKQLDKLTSPGAQP